MSSLFVTLFTPCSPRLPDSLSPRVPTFVPHPVPQTPTGPLFRLQALMPHTYPSRSQPGPWRQMQGHGFIPVLGQFHDLECPDFRGYPLRSVPLSYSVSSSDPYCEHFKTSGKLKEQCSEHSLHSRIYPQCRLYLYHFIVFDSA